MQKLSRPADFKLIPIVIISFNRLSYLKLLVDRLLNDGYKDIVIVDNKSTYLPLLDYYEQVKSNPCIRIVRMSANYGYQVFRKSCLKDVFSKGYYCLTDCDVIPADQCPDNFVHHFYKTMQEYSLLRCGFALKIDDLPDHYPFKKQVIQQETEAHWKNKEADKEIYRVQIDTTFCLYAPGVTGEEGTGPCARTGDPYLAKHMTWYENYNSPTEEEVFYCKQVGARSSVWGQMGKQYLFGEAADPHTINRIGDLVQERINRTKDTKVITV